MTNDQKKNLLIYEAISYESAVEASARRDGLTLTERNEARQFVDGMRARVLEKQRADRSEAPAGRVRPSILAMVREAVERRFASPLVAYPEAVFPHRDLTEIAELRTREAAGRRHGLAHDLVDRLLREVREVERQALEETGFETHFDFLAAFRLEIRIAE